MILTAELEPQCHRHAGDVAPAVDGMTTRKGDQREDWIGLLFDEPADLEPPRLIDPLDHGEGKVFLVPELVTERATGIAGFACHLLEHEVAVAVARKAPLRPTRAGRCGCVRFARPASNGDHPPTWAARTSGSSG